MHVQIQIFLSRFNHVHVLTKARSAINFDTSLGLIMCLTFNFCRITMVVTSTSIFNDVQKLTPDII